MHARGSLPEDAWDFHALRYTFLVPCLVTGYCSNVGDTEFAVRRDGSARAEVVAAHKPSGYTMTTSIPVPSRAGEVRVEGTAARADHEDVAAYDAAVHAALDAIRAGDAPALEDALRGLRRLCRDDDLPGFGDRVSVLRDSFGLPDHLARRAAALALRSHGDWSCGALPWLVAAACLWLTGGRVELGDVPGDRPGETLGEVLRVLAAAAGYDRAAAAAVIKRLARWYGDGFRDAPDDGEWVFVGYSKFFSPKCYVRAEWLPPFGLTADDVQLGPEYGGGVNLERQSVFRWKTQKFHFRKII